LTVASTQVAETHNRWQAYNNLDINIALFRTFQAQNHENAEVRNIGQGEPRHRKYKRLKLGGGQAYDRSSD
jgi:hypothetical protein